MPPQRHEPGTSPAEGAVLWEPPATLVNESNMAAYMRWLAMTKELRFSTYDELWKWSITDIEGFWASLWGFFEVGAADGREVPLAARKMPGAVWFQGAKLNYAEQVLRRASASRPGLYASSETESLQRVPWATVERQVASVAAELRARGIRAGDRVAAYLPNRPEAIVAFLAVVSIGAIWSMCPPEYGTAAVVDRFRQIGPRVLFAVTAYDYGGRRFDRREVVDNLRATLATVELTVLVGNVDPATTTTTGTDVVAWGDIIRRQEPLMAEPVDFAHPLWVVYTSGTTGPPKPIVHSHGGILLEYLKNAILANDRKADDRVQWYTSTGWILWNLLVGNLLAGASLVLYDGSPSYPDVGVLWRLAAEAGATTFGCSPAFLELCIRQRYEPKEHHDLSRLRQISVSGAPLSTAAAAWVYRYVSPDCWLVTGSGGTDVASAFVGASPLVPVRAGAMQARLLGVDVRAVDEQGCEVTDQVGELVVAKPMPSMPVSFWGDASGDRYRDAYFQRFPGMWCHGDWIKIRDDGSSIIYGRSDATINRRGVRIGTGELYRVLDAVPGVVDSLVVDLVRSGSSGYMSLFVVLAPGLELGPQLQEVIRRRIRDDLSPRHVPDEIVAVGEIPRTLTGKKLEVPIKRILQGEDLESVISLDAVANPAALDPFVARAKQGTSVRVMAIIEIPQR